MRWTLVVLVLLAVLGGCHRHHRRDAAGNVPRVTARRMSRLLEIAGRDLSCPPSAVSAVPVTDRVYRATGCGNWSDYAIFGTHARSARWRRVLPIADRVAADLSCPATSVTFTPLTPTSYTVAGCGRGASYDLRCSETDCGWVGVPSSGGAAAGGGGATASIVIIVPATSGPLSVDVDGEVGDDDGE